jgi:segregation and condensation protein B
MATEPIAAADLAASLAVSEADVTAALEDLARFYAETGRGFELRRVGAGWRYYTHPDLADVIGQSILAGQHGRLTQAALETLAVISYLQPISRSRIAAVRGVNVDGVVRTLLARDLIAETGKDEATGAGLLTTTDYFLERMGLSSLDDLPALAPNLPDAAALDAELTTIVTQSMGADTPEATGSGTVATERAEAMGSGTVATERALRATATGPDTVADPLKETDD